MAVMRVLPGRRQERSQAPPIRPHAIAQAMALRNDIFD